MTTTDPDARIPKEEAPDGAADRGRVRLLDLTHAALERELSATIDALGERSFRIGQIRRWLYTRDAESFEAMSDLPKSLRTALAERYIVHPLSVLEHRVSSDGTQKFLWARADTGDIESVLIPDGDRITYCVSSQAGCAVKCPFCATGYGGFQGQLSAGEIIDQVLQMRARTGLAPTNVVYMGMGEPLLNLEAVLDSLSTLTDSELVGLGSRRVTVSTVGIPDRIRELSKHHPQVKIALSLHAARDEVRDELVPMNRKFPLREVLGTIRETAGRTGRRATMEYVVLPGVNDAPSDADDLANLLRDVPARINLIGFNPFPEAPYSKPTVRALVAFQKRLAERFRGPVTLRRARGDDIQGACGQLRADVLRRPETASDDG